MSAREPVRAEPRWVRRKEARPDEITHAALELFVERGYAGTRLEDVAARAGVSKGTVYLYFANKEDLFKTVVREGLVSALAEVRGVIEKYEGRMLELLRMVLFGWWERLGSTRISGIPKLVIAEALNFPEIAEFYLAEVVQPGQQAVRDIIRRGIASGEFKRVDPDQTAHLVVAPLLMIALWRNSLGPYRPDMLDPVRVIDAHLEMLRCGLAPEPGRPAAGARGKV